MTGKRKSVDGYGAGGQQVAAGAQYIHRSTEENVTVRFRVGQPYRNAAVCVYVNGQLLRRIPKRVLAPGEMEKVILRPADLPAEGGSIRFCIEEGTN